MRRVDGTTLDEIYGAVLIDAGDFERYVLTRPKREMVRALLRVSEYMPPEELGLLAADIWRSGPRRAGSRDEWGELFRALPPGVFMRPAERAAFDALADPIPVFRGYREGGSKGATDARGRAWSTDEPIACFFSQELPELRAAQEGREADGEPRLAIGKVDKRNTVAYLLKHGEWELVVPDPALVAIEGIRAVKHGAAV